MDPPGVRVDRMMEHVAVLRGLFADGPLDFAGQHYRISGLDGSPKPFRPGGPPILIGGGSHGLLTFAAQHADIIGVNPSLPTSATRPDQQQASMDEKFAWIRAAAGPRLGELEFHAWLRFAGITGNARAEAESLAGEFRSGGGGSPGLARRADRQRRGDHRPAARAAGAMGLHVLHGAAASRPAVRGRAGRAHPRLSISGE